MRLKRYKKKTVGIYIAREIIFIIGGIIVSIWIINVYYKKFNKVIIKQMTEGEKVSIDQAYDSIKWNTTDELTKKIDKIQ